MGFYKKQKEIEIVHAQNHNFEDVGKEKMLVKATTNTRAIAWVTFTLYYL